MKSFAPLLACAACLLTVPAYAASSASTDNPVVLAGAQFCVGPACVGRSHDRDGRYRHGREYHQHYRDDRGYGYDRDQGYDRDRGDYRYGR
jgi:hypothetical protein